MMNFQRKNIASLVMPPKPHFELLVAASWERSIAYFSFIPKYCKLPAHMYDKVSVVDRFSFSFSSRNSF